VARGVASMGEVNIGFEEYISGYRRAQPVWEPFLMSLKRPKTPSRSLSNATEKAMRCNAASHDVAAGY
jgi:hypothetical protein